VANRSVLRGVWRRNRNIPRDVARQKFHGLTNSLQERLEITCIAIAFWYWVIFVLVSVCPTYSYLKHEARIEFVHSFRLVLEDTRIIRWRKSYLALDIKNIKLTHKVNLSYL
jgi:hypothetical protein